MGNDTYLEVTEVTLDELPVFLTVEEAAAVLRIGRSSAYVLCHRWRASCGEAGLPCVQVGRQLRVPRSALVRMAETAGNAA
jgi:excisionase family DNA binding protein